MDILPIGIDASMQAFNNVRIPIITIDGEACMVVLDIGKALEYQDPRAVLVHLDELDQDEIIELTGDRLRAVKARLIDSMSRGDSENYRRINRLTLVTRSGAEALAMAAKTGRAKEFRRWIRKIVLPAYRKQATEQAAAQAAQGSSSQGAYVCRAAGSSAQAERAKLGMEGDHLASEGDDGCRA